jgi:hypothetical protein
MTFCHRVVVKNMWKSRVRALFYRIPFVSEAFAAGYLLLKK